MERTDKAQIDQVAQEGTDVVRDLEDDVTWSAKSNKAADFAECQAHALTESGSIMETRASLTFPRHHSSHSQLVPCVVHMHTFHFDLIEKSSRNRRATSLTRADAPPSQLKNF